MPRSRAAPSSAAASSSERAPSPATNDHTASPTSLATRSVEPMLRWRTPARAGASREDEGSRAQALLGGRGGSELPPHGSGAADWFLTAEERGNSATQLDRRRGDGKARAEGNPGPALAQWAADERRAA